MSERAAPPRVLMVDNDIYLRRLEPDASDMNALHVLLQDNANGDIGKFLPWTRQVDVPKLQGFARVMNERAQNGEGAPYGVFERRELVGHVALFGFRGDLGDRQASIGYYLDKAATGKGIMLRAARRIISMGFYRMQLDRVVAEIDSDNHRSRSVMEGLGATRLPNRNENGEDVFVVVPQ